MPEEKEVPKRKKSEPPPRKSPPKLVFPRRKPSVVIPPRQIIYITADKITCVDCTCYPKEEPYQKPKKLKPCQFTPRTLYELAADVVDSLSFPDAFTWGEDEVVKWMSEDLGFPEYKECILDNNINGLRLLMLEDPSKVEMIGIRNWEHVKIVTAGVRKLFKTEFILFTRSIGLPPRKPLTHCTWFKSRTGPSWGIRVNWTRSDILRWMEIIMPKPIYRDHWDLVWYHKPDFPKVMFARVQKDENMVRDKIPRYVPPAPEPPREYLAPRKFRLQTGITESNQYIWMERRDSYFKLEEEKRKPKPPRIIVKETSLFPNKVSTKGLKGKELILARRLLPRQKFFKLCS